MSNLQHKGVKGMKWRPKHLRNKPAIKNNGDAIGVGLGNIKALQNKEAMNRRVVYAGRIRGGQVNLVKLARSNYKEARNRKVVGAGRIRGGQVNLVKLARSNYKTENLKETFSKTAKQAANGVKKKKEKTYKIRKIGIPALLFKPRGKKRG